MTMTKGTRFLILLTQVPVLAYGMYAGPWWISFIVWVIGMLMLGAAIQIWAERRRKMRAHGEKADGRG